MNKRAKLKQLAMPDDLLLYNQLSTEAQACLQGGWSRGEHLCVGIRLMSNWILFIACSVGLSGLKWVLVF